MTPDRRHAIQALPAAMLYGVAASLPHGQALAHANERRVFVLVHGAWHGGWCWSQVASALQAAGHAVYAPTQTGLGDRSHLLSKLITLDTFVDDVVNTIEFERLDQVVLVGHSFGGITITGVADRLPGRLRQLIYLDSLILENGQTAFGQMPSDMVSARMKMAEESSGGLSLPVPPPEAFASFGITKPEHRQFIGSRLTPHPLSTYTSPLNLRHPVANGLPAAYLRCSAPEYAPLAKTKEWVRSKGWPISELTTGHEAMISAPAETARELMRLAA